MSWVLELARSDIRDLRAYEHATWEPGLTRLHANELPWRGPVDASAAGLNRYPEPHPHELAAALARYCAVPEDSVLAGRGSDELIDLLVRAYCRAERDAVLICPPTFGMYGVAARIQGAAVHEVALRREAGWELDTEAVRLAALSEAQGVKLVFVCSPNNPTGNRFDEAALLSLIRALQGHALLVVDEAYIEFADAPSLAARVAHNPGLVVLRTLSKAHGLAGARCGLAIAHPQIIGLLRKVIPPYAITQPTIETVLAALRPEALAPTSERIATLRGERVRVAQALQTLPGVQRVWPSETNFLLVDFADAGAALERAHRAGLLVRDLRGHPLLRRSLRISLGTAEQNDRLLACLR